MDIKEAEIIVLRLETKLKLVDDTKMSDLTKEEIEAINMIYPVLSPERILELERQWGII